MITRLLFVLATALLAASQSDKENVLPTSITRLLPDQLVINATVGETVKFPCDIKDFVVLRKKEESKVLFVGSLRVIRDDRFQIIRESSGTSLQITGVLPKDSGEYSCHISTDPPIESTHTVTVLFPPSIKPKPSPVIAKVGKSFLLSCNATGYPTPTISWKHGGHYYENAANMEITISNAQRNDSGEYECTADNGVGDAATATFIVKILYAPEIEVPVSCIYPSEGTTTDIICIVHGEPIPSVMWKHEDQVIHSNEHYKLINIGDYNILQIRSLQEEDFGRYECVANNSLDNKAGTVHIIGRPQIPSFTSEPNGTRGTEYVLSWMTKSCSLVDEYSLMYRKKMEGEDWVTINVSASDVSELIETQTYQITDLEPATSYEAVVTAHNIFGWSTQSATFGFSTKHEATVKLTILKGLEDVTAYEGETIQLIVKFNGDPKPTMKWSRVGDTGWEIDDDRIQAKHETEDSFTLIFQNVTKDDEGEYECVLTNEFKTEASSSSKLTVKETCNSNTCRNGKCSQFGANYYSCKCNPGYIGIKCDQDISLHTADRIPVVLVGVILGVPLLISIIVFGIKFRSLKHKFRKHLREQRMREMTREAAYMENEYCSVAYNGGQLTETLVKDTNL